MYCRVVAFMNPESHPDLRNAVRFPLHLAVTLKTPTDEHRAETIDISAGGILFRTETPVEVGSAVEFTVSMPGDVLGSDRDVLVRCQGRVVRCNEESSGRSVAVVIDEYRFERI
jgi:c-di-GMP-binding flagellar brake protein YcgR